MNINLNELENVFVLLIKYNINSFTYSKDGESFTVNGISEAFNPNQKPKEPETIEDAIEEYLNEKNLNG